MTHADASSRTILRTHPGVRAFERTDVDDEATYVVRIDPLTETGRRAAEAIATVADSSFGVRGLSAGRDSVSWPATLAAGVYAAGDVPTLLRGPTWTAVHLEPAVGWSETVELDLRTGVVRHVVRHDAQDSHVEVARFLSAADGGVAVQTCAGPRSVVTATDPLLPASSGESTSVTFVNGVEVVVSRDVASGASVVVAAHDDVDEIGDLRTVTRFVGMAAGFGDLLGATATDRLALARRLGADELGERHRHAWMTRWSGCGTWLADRPDLERAIRFATFHLLCCGSAAGPSDRRTGAGAAVEDQRAGTPTGETAIGARGLTGTAYRGHVFWDTDVFVVPALSAIAPIGARRALNYRWARLESARARAEAEGRHGARFPWESAGGGDEVTPRTGRDMTGRETMIRTGEMEEHITADIAWSVGNYVDWTGDDEFLRRRGLEILVATARYWASRVEFDDDGSGHVRRVIGPDEYHEAVDDNAFTNVMARHNLLISADAAERFGACDQGETRFWREVAERIVDGFDPVTGLYEQFTGYHQLTDMAAALSIAQLPLSADVLFGREVISRSRVIKQPDVLMAYHLVPDRMREHVVDANLDYYARHTAHGSSLSPAIMASLFFRARRWDDAMQLLELAGALDLDDLTGTTPGGLHLATMGGLWQAVTYGLLGMRADRFGLTLDPRVPPDLGTARHRVVFRGRVLTVAVDGDSALVTATAPLDLRVGGEMRRGSKHRLGATTSGWEHR